MKQKISLIGIASALLVVASCTHKPIEEPVTPQTPAADHVTHHEPQKDCNDVHWSHHQGEDGPENWANLCDGFSDCGSNAQSPINIITANVLPGDSLAAPKFSYGESKVNIINNSHTVQFNVDGDNTVVLNGKSYQLLQFHYHALSEHMIDGENYPIEVHFVHKHSDTDYAVISVLYVVGVENELFNNYLALFPPAKGEFNADGTIDLMSLLPENNSYYHYQGSLTTPPCSEVVSWYVLKNTIEASAAQIEQFSAILNHNYRPVLPLNGRTVQLYSE